MAGRRLCLNVIKVNLGGCRGYEVVEVMTGSGEAQRYLGVVVLLILPATPGVSGG